MMIYRCYDMFTGLYGAMYGYESLHANTKVLALAIGTGVAVWALLEALLAVGLYCMAKRRGMKNRALAFIPLVNMVYAGRIAGDCEFFGQKMKHVGVFAAVTQTLLFLVGVFTIFVKTSLYTNYIPTVVEGGMLFFKKADGSNPAGALANFFIRYNSVSSMILSVLELIYTVMLFIVASGLFKKYAPASHMMLSFLALFVSVSFPIAVFALRNRTPVNYADYVKKRQEAYYRRYGNPYGGNPYGNPSSRNPYGQNGRSPYGGGAYGSKSDDPFAEYGGKGEQSEGEPFAEFGGSGNGEKGESPFSDIEG